MLPPRQPLRRTNGLAIAVVALLATQMALIVAEIVSRFHQADLLRQLQATGLITQQQLDAADGLVSGTAGFGVLAFLTTIVLWCVWQHRAQENARVLATDGGLRFTPGWAVGWWFVPIASIWKPFQAVRELWQASHGGMWRTVASWSLLGWWWATWLIGSLNVQAGSTFHVGILFGGGADIEQLSVADAIAQDRWRVVWLGFRVVAAVLAIVIVRSVERLQRAADTARQIVAAPVAVAVAVADAPAAPDAIVGVMMPPPPPTAPTVQDAPSSGERALILGVVIGTLALSIGGQIWAGRSHPVSGSGPGVSPGAGATYADHGVRFTYPSGWTVGPASISHGVGTPADWTDGVGPADASTYDIVSVSQYTLPGDAVSLYPGQQQAMIERLTDSLLTSLGGTKTAPVAPVKIGGLQGYHVLMSVTLEGDAVAVDFNVLFLDKQEYTIVCEATDAARAAIATGCSSVRGTFTVTG